MLGLSNWQHPTQRLLCCIDLGALAQPGVQGSLGGHLGQEVRLDSQNGPFWPCSLESNQPIWQAGVLVPGMGGTLHTAPGDCAEHGFPDLPAHNAGWLLQVHLLLLQVHHLHIFGG